MSDELEKCFVCGGLSCPSDMDEAANASGQWSHKDTGVCVTALRAKVERLKKLLPQPDHFGPQAEADLAKAEPMTIIEQRKLDALRKALEKKEGLLGEIERGHECAGPLCNVCAILKELPEDDEEGGGE